MDHFRARRPVSTLAVFGLVFVLSACGDKSEPTELSLPSTLILVSGDGQQVVNGPSAASQELVVRVLDPLKRGVANVPVTWSSPVAGSSVAPLSPTTDAEGFARARWTLGAAEGIQFAQATAPTIPGASVRFQGAHVVLAIHGAVTRGFQPTVLLNMGTPTVGENEGVGARMRAGFGFGGSDVDGAPSRAPAATGRILVGHRSGGPGTHQEAPITTAGGLAAAHQRMNTTLARLRTSGVVAHAEVSPVLLASRVQIPAHLSVEAALEVLRADPDVAWAEEDQRTYGIPPVERAPHPRRQPGSITRGPVRSTGLYRTLSNDYLLPLALWHYNMIDAPRAWTQTTGSRSVVVAVIDDGIRFDHPSVAGNLTSDGYNFVAAGNLLGRDEPVCGGGTTRLPEEGYGPDPTQPEDWAWRASEGCWALSRSGNHGLHVAGTIGAVGNQDMEFPGINWNVSIRPIRVLNKTGRGSWFDVAQGILYAAGLPASDGNGGTVTAPSAAPILNMSLGGSNRDPLVASAVRAAQAAGSLIVASAGNSRSLAPSYPAALPGVVSVVALGPSLDVASYSNIGNTVSLAAPGGDFRSNAGVFSSTWDFRTNEPEFDFWQGTSMAAPHVSGVAALVLANEPGLSADALRARLEQTAVPVGQPGWDPRFGFGLVNAYNAVRNIREPTRNVFVRLHDAQTGKVVSQVAADQAGRFRFDGLAEGSYFVVAGEDDRGDAAIGLLRRRFGWFGQVGVAPQVVALQAGSAAPGPVGIHVGSPRDLRRPDQLAPIPLLVGTYMFGQITTQRPRITFEVLIPEAAMYTFETAGAIGSCGFGDDADTILELFGPTGTLIELNEDTDMEDSYFCSRIQRQLTPGRYQLHVTSWEGFPGHFAVMARRGP
jgi:subtilisin family serine protease